jgi:hypothetical protein
VCAHAVLAFLRCRMQHKLLPSLHLQGCFSKRFSCAEYVSTHLVPRLCNIIQLRNFVTAKLNLSFMLSIPTTYSYVLHLDLASNNGWLKYLPDSCVIKPS